MHPSAIASALRHRRTSSHKCKVSPRVPQVLRHACITNSSNTFGCQFNSDILGWLPSRGATHKPEVQRQTVLAQAYTNLLRSAIYKITMQRPFAHCFSACFHLRPVRLQNRSPILPFRNKKKQEYWHLNDPCWISLPLEGRRY